MTSTIAVVCWLGGALLVCHAQGQPPDRTTALPPAEIELLDSSSAAHLENSKRFLAEQQWAEAVEAIRRVEEAAPNKLVSAQMTSPVAGFERFVPAGEFCQWRLAALASEAPAALEHYRRLVDPLAESWFRQGEQTGDESLFRRVVERGFASRLGDDALLKLGDLALARGDFTTARAAWQRIAPSLSVSNAWSGPLRAPAGAPVWLALRRFDFRGHGSELATLLRSPGTPLAGIYPDTDLDLAAVQARLVLASILEGSPERAAIEVAVLRLLYPRAGGKLAGREGLYAEILQDLFEASAAWPAVKRATGWPTFAGDASRGMTVADDFHPAGTPLWSFPLPRLSAEHEAQSGERLRPGDDWQALLSYHPIVVDGKVLVRFDRGGNSYVVALDLKSGKQLWAIDYSRGVVNGTENDLANGESSKRNDTHAGLTQQVGVARYTMTARGNKVFARLGSPITLPSSRRAALWLAKEQGFVLGMDLTAQGKPLEGFPLRPPSKEWTLDGTPVVGDGVFYVAMRKVEGARPQIYIAAFEMQTAAMPSAASGDENAADKGRLKWRTPICSSATVGGGDLDELTHLLLSADGSRLYLNTNAGVVAAVDPESGHLVWLVKYPRAGLQAGNSSRAQRHFARDLVPCLLWKDLAIVAPADCDRIFAIEAATGRIVWSLPQDVADDAVHLLGVVDDVLLASGDYLYWIDALTGRLLTQFPPGRLGGAEQAAPLPRGLGRGLIVGPNVWFPTRESIFVFAGQPVATDFGFQPKLIREISLLPRGVTGGNLIVADRILLIATGDKLVAFGE